MLNSDLLIPVGYETSKYGYAPRQTSRSNGWTPHCPNKRSIKEIYEVSAWVHSNDREGVPMAKAGRLCILKKEMAPLLQVVTSYSSPELMELTWLVIINSRRPLRKGATGKMLRMAVSMGITGLSMNLLQMHEQDEIYKEKNEKSFVILEVQRVHNHFVTDRRKNLINVELKKNEMASIINQIPKNKLQGILGEDVIRKPLNEFNAEQQGQLKDLAINHFAVKNEIIAQMKYLYPGDEWEFTKVIQEKFFQG
ncbi:hypothetical protein Tco_1483249 [Tanacetum coccineum]